MGTIPIVVQSTPWDWSRSKIAEDAFAYFFTKKCEVIKTPFGGLKFVISVISPLSWNAIITLITTTHEQGFGLRRLEAIVFPGY